MCSLVRAEARSPILNWIMMLSILLAHKITWHIYIYIYIYSLAVALNPPQPGPEADLLCYLFVSQEDVRKKKFGLPRIPSPSLSLSQFVAIPCNRTLT
jgi:hypothetical protein